jgi:disulfide bond formation protein DsbB
MPSATDHSANGGMLGWMLPHFFLGAISVPLLAAFWVEFIWQEAPCTLCLLQRMCMLLAGMGPLWILSQQADPSRVAPLAPLALWSRGFGISVLAGALGLSIALRQILLHILPDDPGFGSPVLGYHLYSWAFGIFVLVLLCSGGCLLFAQTLAPATVGKKSKITWATIGLFGALIFANTLVVSYKAMAAGLAAGDLQ